MFDTVFTTANGIAYRCDLPPHAKYALVDDTSYLELAELDIYELEMRWFFSETEKHIEMWRFAHAAVIGQIIERSPGRELEVARMGTSQWFFDNFSEFHAQQVGRAVARGIANLFPDSKLAKSLLELELAQ